VLYWVGRSWSVGGKCQKGGLLVGGPAAALEGGGGR
jgi:hypothetical protein